jgi:hypothetical protein
MDAITQETIDRLSSENASLRSEIESYRKANQELDQKWINQKETIKSLQAENHQLKEENEKMKYLIKSDSVYTLLRYGTKSPSSSGVDDCELERLYYDLYSLSCELRKPPPPQTN